MAAVPRGSAKVLVVAVALLQMWICVALSMLWTEVLTAIPVEPCAMITDPTVRKLLGFGWKFVMMLLPFVMFPVRLTVMLADVCVAVALFDM